MKGIRKLLTWALLLAVVALAGSATTFAVEAGSYVGIQAPEFIGQTGEYEVEVWFEDDGEQVTLQGWKILVQYPDGESEVTRPAERSFTYVISHYPELSVGYRLVFTAIAYTDQGEFTGKVTIRVKENDFSYLITGPRTAAAGMPVTYNFLRKSTCGGGFATVSLLNDAGDGDVVAAFTSESAHVQGSARVDWKVEHQVFCNLHAFGSGRYYPSGENCPRGVVYHQIVHLFSS